MIVTLAACGGFFYARIIDDDEVSRFFRIISLEVDFLRGEINGLVRSDRLSGRQPLLRARQGALKRYLVSAINPDREVIKKLVRSL